MRKITIAIMTVALVATGLAVSAQTPIDELRAQIDALRADFDKSHPDAAVQAELLDLYAQYAEAWREANGGPANDDCANAIPISCGDSIAFSTLGATNDGNFSCGLGDAEIWYTITGNGGSMTFSICPGGADYDTVLNASTGACGALGEVACNDDTCGLQSEIFFPTVGGTTYWIGLGGFGGDTGTGTLDVACEVPVALQGFDIE